MIGSRFTAYVIVACSFCVSAFAQLPEPQAGESKPVTIPKIVEKTLPNGLKVAVVQKSNVPLVTARLVILKGASAESPAKAGLADVTAAMLTKGTKTRSATEIAEAIEFLGGSINSGASWNASFVSVSVTSDKLAQALAIMGDVVQNPKFDKDEIDLLKSQTLDGLTYNLKQPSFLANHVSSVYSFGEHPTGGTKASVESITRDDVAEFYRSKYHPDSAVLVFTGDITRTRAAAVAERFFGNWKKGKSEASPFKLENFSSPSVSALFRRILVIDLPKSGQAAVTYAKKVQPVERGSQDFFTASVLNSVLGGGYSSRLNYEIRIKRGLSYGAGSNFGWRRSPTANFAAQVQTKNESAAEVAELIGSELQRITQTRAESSELTARKAVLTGGFGRNLETGAGIAAAVGDLFVFGLPFTELNEYVADIEAVTPERIADFAGKYLVGGDIIIAGDYSIFKDDLAKRFPSATIDVIKADEIDLNKENLRK